MQFGSSRFTGSWKAGERLELVGLDDERMLTAM
jgi:hypothetical protein